MNVLQLRRLVDLPVAFCLDTAHCFQAGLSFPSLLDTLVDVPVIHTNDSRAPFGSRVDRHEHIGKGGIGRAGFRELLANPRLGDRTLILETPVEKPGDDRPNVRALRLLAAKA